MKGSRDIHNIKRSDALQAKLRDLFGGIQPHQHPVQGNENACKQGQQALDIQVCVLPLRTNFKATLCITKICISVFI
jgi:hypothetical protein